ARWLRGAALIVWLVMAGLGWQALRAPQGDPFGLGAGGAEGPWLVRVTSLSAVRERRIVAEGVALARIAGQSPEPRRGKVLLTLLREGGQAVAPAVGDAVWVDGELAAIGRTPDPGGFDRAARAEACGLAHELLAPAGHWRIAGHERRWTDAFQHARAGIAAWLDASGMAPRELALVKALVLGLRDELDGEQRTAFARSGTIHVLAVSGMHVGLVYAALMYALGRLGKGARARWARGMLVLAALWGYAGLTGASPSVVRAAFMFSLFALAGFSRRQPDHLNSLFAAAFFLLLYDPGLLTQAGFQLSFLAVLGIILFYAPLSRIWSPASRLLRQAWGLVAVSASAQLLTAPLAMVLFKAFPIWFLPANLVVVSAVSLAVYGGAALIALSWVPLLGEALALALQALLRFLQQPARRLPGGPDRMARGRAALCHDPGGGRLVAMALADDAAGAPGLHGRAGAHGRMAREAGVGARVIRGVRRFARPHRGR
ncbi:MAG: ComEC/Rec2 family competence protein, partial [Flavobacteriales bacterium]